MRTVVYGIVVSNVAACQRAETLERQQKNLYEPSLCGGNEHFHSIWPSPAAAKITGFQIVREDGSPIEPGGVLPEQTAIYIHAQAESSGGCLFTSSTNTPPTVDCAQNFYPYTIESVRVLRNEVEIGRIQPRQGSATSLDSREPATSYGPKMDRVYPGRNDYLLDLSMFASSATPCSENPRPSKIRFTLYGGDARDLSNSGPADCNAAVGEPVNVTNGNMYRDDIDHDVPGLRGFAIRRTFNSIRAVEELPALFGAGWSSTLDERIYRFGPHLTRFDRADGRSLYFLGDGEGVHAQYAKTAVDHLMLSFEADGSARIAEKSGRTRHFDGSGRLTQISDRNGPKVTFTYDTRGLSRVSTPGGYNVIVQLNDHGRIQSLADAMGTIATYSYGLWGIPLQKVQYGDGSELNYRTKLCQGWLFDQVTDRLGNLLEAHAYDGTCRATTSERAGGVEKYSISYVSPTETHVTDALGVVSKFKFTKHHAVGLVNELGANRVTSVEGPCRCAP